jgi:hypothetical protein
MKYLTIFYYGFLYGLCTLFNAQSDADFRKYSVRVRKSRKGKRTNIEAQE